jgi:hypothetical protein
MARRLVVLTGAIVLQIADLHRAYHHQRAMYRSAEFHAWANPLPSPAWHQLLPHYDRVVCGSLDAVRVCVTATSYERWRSLVRLN